MSQSQQQSVSIHLMIHPPNSQSPSPGSTVMNVIEDSNITIDYMSLPPPVIPTLSESSNLIYDLDSLVVDTFSVITVSSFIVKHNQDDPYYLGASGSFVCPFCKEQAAQYYLDNFVPKKLEMYMRPPTSLLEDALSVMLVIFRVAIYCSFN